MKKMKYLRSWLTIALVVTIIGSLTGGTVAWFTDNVESTNNVIQSGTLDVELYVADSNLAVDSTDWKDVEDEETGAIFSYDLWEPGYTTVKYLKLVNNGNLAFKYQIKLVPNQTIDTTGVNLAEVIDAYYKVVDDSFTAPAKASDVMAWGAPVNLETMLDVPETAVHGVMLDDQEPMVIALALHMQEGADNKYQNLSIAEHFSIQLLATQYTHEEDAFNDQYDQDAQYGEDDENVDSDLPTAKVTQAETNLTVDLYNLDDFSTPIGTKTLDVTYVFETTETYTEAQSNPYADWIADYVVSFDKAIAKDSLGLGGAYGSYNVGFHAPMDIAADEEIPLLSTLFQLTYADLCKDVKVFTCGAFDLNGANDGTTMTVELRLYNPDDASDYKIIKSIDYTF